MALFCPISDIVALIAKGFLALFLKYMLHSDDWREALGCSQEPSQGRRRSRRIPARRRPRGVTNQGRRAQCQAVHACRNLAFFGRLDNLIVNLVEFVKKKVVAGQAMGEALKGRLETSRLV